MDDLKNIHNDPYFDKTIPFKPDLNYNPYPNSRVLSEYDKNRYEINAHKCWDMFYQWNTRNFFKNRHWIHREFHEIVQNTKCRQTLMEVGCGVGNTILPLLEYAPHLYFYAFDFSSKAIELLHKDPKFDKNRICAFVCDATKEEISHVKEEVDFVTMIFVLSAISPEKMPNMIKHVHQKMKKGGICFVRDYAVNDLAQRRFGKDRKIDENFFARYDGTRAYYFSIEFLRNLFVNAGFKEIENKYCEKFVENAKEEKKMNRIFIQAKFQKV